jgi:putative cardiolipin synthase
MRITNIFRLYCLLILLGTLSACASVDFDYPKETSTAITETRDTDLARAMDPLEALHPGQSGFNLLFDGIDALAARLLLAEEAEKTIDAQYYLITDDSIGFVFIGALIQAADRGVRVRLLLDDIQTNGYDAGMAGLDSHPNIEVRIFNPFSGRFMKNLNDVFSFSRVNRRMHNKSFTIDNEITIIGGRNIADEYYGARSDINFGDVDVMAIGPVVREVSDMFDIYWNHKSAVPVPGFAKMPDDPATALLKLREKIEAQFKAINQTQYAEAVKADFDRFMQADVNIFTWADYELAYDSPDKVYKKAAKSGEIKTIASTLATTIESAEKELIVISPYFVPRKKGIEFFQELRDRDIEVTIVTNSLAATNHAIVHSGYMGSRKPLLEMGVKIHEVRFTAGLAESERGGTGAELATLHTKAFIVDCKDLFIGSFNWDPRSLNINTELGVVIKSEELATDICDNGNDGLSLKTYEVFLNEKGKVRWRDNSGPEPVVYDKEPDSGFWRRFSAGFWRIMPVKSQL